MGSRGGEGWRRLAATQRDSERWQIVERTGQAVQQLADPEAPHSRTNKPGGTKGGAKQTAQPRAPARGKSLKPLIENTRGG